jgi:hypothetical protein
MSLSAFFRWLERHFRNKALMILFLAALNLGVYALVLATGGIKYVYSHSMYIPILLAGFVFGARGGVLAGLAGGVVLGPFMPIETATGEPQLLLNWLYRTGLFTLIGLFNGVAVDMLRRQLREIDWLARHAPLPGFPTGSLSWNTSRHPAGKAGKLERLLPPFSPFSPKTSWRRGPLSESGLRTKSWCRCMTACRASSRTGFPFSAPSPGSCR